MTTQPIIKRKNPCVYRFFDANGTLLYIGATLSVFNRVTNHSSQFKWYRDVATITIEHKETAHSAFNAEKQAIRAERPLYNMANAFNEDGTPKIINKPRAWTGPSDKEKEMAQAVAIRLNGDYSTGEQLIHISKKAGVGYETLKKIKGGYVPMYRTSDKLLDYFKKIDRKAAKQ